MTNAKITSENELVEAYDLPEEQDPFTSDDYNDLPIELIPSSRKSKFKCGKNRLNSF